MDSSLQDALRGLPHGPEFRFIDRIVSLIPGRHGTAEYLIRGTEPFLKGHFPGDPLMPGVLLLEAAAQLAGSVAQSDPAIDPLPNLRLTAVRQAKILGSARPGDRLLLEARVQGRLGPLIQCQGSVKVQDRLICQAEFVLSGQVLDPTLSSP